MLMDDEPHTASTLTVENGFKRIMLKAPYGPGRSRHVSLEELERFITQAKAEARSNGIPDERYESWVTGRNVALQDSQLYVDTPWGPKREQ